MSNSELAGNRHSPVFKYMVYRVFRIRGGSAYVRSFEVCASGHLWAKKYMSEHPEHEYVSDMFGTGVTTFFSCIKLMEPMSVDASLDGRCEYVGETELSDAQVAYFECHRVM